MHKRLRVGIIGFGVSGRFFHAPFIDASDDLTLNAVVTGKPDIVKALYPKVLVVESLEELLNQDIDLVVVASPTYLHFEHTRQALEAGKHVLVEKPFVPSSSQGQELIKLAHRKGRILSVYHNRRWDGGFLTVRRCVEENAVGPIRSYTARVDRARPTVDPHRWRDAPKEGSGYLFDLGSHLIDQALTLFGLPDTVSAILAIQRKDSEVEDFFRLTLLYERLVVTVQSCCFVWSRYPHFELHGERGSFVKYHLDPQEDALRKGDNPKQPEWGRETPDKFGKLVTYNGTVLETRSIETLPGSYQTFYRELAQSIQTNTPPPVQAEDALRVIKLLELAKESALSGRVLRCGK